MDLGMNIEPRLAGRIMEVASSMMSNAISAKNLKVDKKLKMIWKFHVDLMPLHLPQFHLTHPPLPYYDILIYDNLVIL